MNLFLSWCLRVREPRARCDRAARAGGGARPRQRPTHTLRLEWLEDRSYLSASGPGALSQGAEMAALLSQPLPAVSQEQAMVLALNDLTAIPEGLVLNNPRHTATFTPRGLLVDPTGGGPNWRWQLDYVGTQSAALAGVNVGRVAPASDGRTTVSYDRGGLIEQYVALVGSVEQQFVIPRPLSLDGGDLVVAGKVKSGGTFDVTSDGWQWRKHGGAVTLGDVSVFDATGRELAASMDVTARGTRIVVPAAALERAVYPLLIDPEVGANDFRISDMGPGSADFDSLEPAVAYNSANDEYLVVWRGDDATNEEFEIYSQRIDAATGDEVGANDFRISDMGPNGNIDHDALNPAVAYNSTNNEFLVVWEGDDSNNEFEIYGQRISGATGGEIGVNDFRISDMGPNGSTSYAAIAPVVAYNSANNQYLVAWNGDDNTAPLVAKEYEIFGQRLDAGSGAEVGVNDFRISDMGTNGNTLFAAYRPALAYNGTSNEYLAVWEGDDATDGEFEIFGQRINGATGAEVGANDFRISDMGTNGIVTFDAYRPAVAFNGTNDEYLVVWEGDDNTAPLVDEEFEVFGQRLDAAGVEIGVNDFRISDMGPNGNAGYDAYAPAVAYHSASNEYLVVWQGDDNTSPLVNGEYESFGQRLNAATGAEVGANDFRISDMGPNGSTSYAAIAPVVAYNGGNQYLVIWAGDDATDNKLEIFSQRLNAAGGAVGTNDFRISDLGGGAIYFEARRPAVAYNPTNNEYLVVWSGEELNFEEEIYGQRINATTGAAVGANDFRISDMGPNGNSGFFAIDPAVAYNSASNEFLVVWMGDDNINGLVDSEIEIFGQRLNAATGAAVGANDFRISDMGPNGSTSHIVFEPAVAYNSASNEFLVVWEGDDDTSPLVVGEREIFGQRLDAAGIAVGANDFRISDMGPNGDTGFDAHDPAVAYNSASNEFLVVWYGDDTTNGEDEVFGQRINSAGTAVGANDFRISDMGTDGDTGFDAQGPALAFNTTNNEYLVVWVGDDTTSNEFEIFGQRINGATGAAVGTNDFRISDMGPDGDLDFEAIAPAVAYHSANNEYLVVWSGDDTTNGEFEIFGQRINAATGAEVGANDFRLSDMGPNGDINFGAKNPAVAFNSATNQYLIVWSGDDNTSPLVDEELEIFGQRFQL